MKKIVGAAILIFWAIATAIITAGLVLYGGQQMGYFKPQDQRGASGITEEQNRLAGVTLTLDEVAKHNKDTDCWLLISGKVYDVSNYVYMHLGDAKTIIPTCGKDATKDYETKDKTIPKDHSQQAYALLANYYIGDLNQAIQPAVVPPSSVPPAGFPSQTQGTGSSEQAPSATVLLSLDEVAGHSSQSDCWMVIGGKVYNLTSYFAFHPGGTNTILTSCGKDGSAAYQTKGGGGSPHSSYAQSLLPTFYLGDINQTTSVSSVQKVQDKVQQDIQSGKLQGGADDDEYEDD
jgi:cytochrome b involved in lipid metabolism